MFISVVYCILIKVIVDRVSQPVVSAATDDVCGLETGLWKKARQPASGDTSYFCR